MSNTTKLALSESLKKLLAQKPLSKITVTDIAEDCGINRMTFYYHFKDIYDLVEWIVREDAAKVIENNLNVDDWNKAMLNIFQMIRENRTLILNVFRSLSREQMETSLHRMLNGLILEALDEWCADGDIDERDLQFVADFYRHAFTGILLDWARDDMREPPESMVRRLEILLRSSVEQVLLAFQKEKRKRSGPGEEAKKTEISAKEVK